jgi:transcriptional regulator with PAS, ATPase and Fis domain
MDRTLQMVGESPAIKNVEEEIQYAARSDAKVLITGESGVGKEIVARQIHRRSGRASGPLVTINCAGFPDSLLETEMFGHVKGSFTDAHRDKRGWLEMAHGGTIFMDEVGEMSLRMQALLLRFLETGEIQRVGSDRHQAPLNVRVITATHRRLLERVADKTFREDLYYRLNVIHIEVPPLRDRGQDIPPLLAHFLREFSTTHRTHAPDLTPGALLSLSTYHWPGNVRELKNIAERIVLRRHSGVIDVNDLPAEVWQGRASRQPGEPASTARPTALLLFDRMVKNGESFWSAVYEPFVARDLTRNDLRELVRMGLEHTRGSYKILASSFNMPATDYKRFMGVLRKYQCHLPFQQFRVLKREPDEDKPEFAARAS